MRHLHETNFSFYTFHLFNHYSNMVNNLTTSFLHVNNLNNKDMQNLTSDYWLDAYQNKYSLLLRGLKCL